MVIQLMAQYRYLNVPCQPRQSDGVIRRP
jgi:hypothetical protein